MRRLLTPLLVLAIANPIFGGKKIPNRNWKTGNLIDVRRSQDFAGTVERPGVVLTNGRRITNDSTQAVYRMQQTFVIETDTHQYTVAEVLGRNQKPANVTVNAPIKFAVEGTIIYLLDEDGREHRTEIVKKVLRTP